MNLYLFLTITTALCGLFQLPFLHAEVIWNSDLISSGQWWRIVTGNLTHTNVYHLAMNMAALWAICYLFKPASKSLAALIALLSLSIGGYLLSTLLHSYAGLSGVLHGLFAYYACQEVARGMRSSWWLVAGVSAKVLYEQAFGASEATAELIGARVATDAHLVGCISGFILFGAYLVWMKMRKN